MHTERFAGLVAWKVGECSRHCGSSGDFTVA